VESGPFQQTVLTSPSHATFASGGSDGHISIWDQTAKKRMKLYTQYPTSISALAFSPDGKKLAIGASYEHDNGVPEADRGVIGLYIKDTVLEDCKVSQ
jgi:cell cycle arrest protein BUB3